jgi:glutaminase
VTAAVADAAAVARASRALLAGNFAIGCGVMVTAGAFLDVAGVLLMVGVGGGIAALV